MDFEQDRYLNTQAMPGISMPFNMDAEQSVLGAVLLDAECLSEVADILPAAEYFYAQNNRHIYGAMLEMYTLGQPVDFVTVLDKLREVKEFDQESGRVYMAQLVKLVPAFSRVGVYAGMVRDAYEIRVLMEAARNILADAGEGSWNSEKLLDAAEQRIFEIRRGKEMRGLRPVKEILMDTFDRLDLLNSPDRDKYRGIPTGIRMLDDTITGLNRSDLIIVSRRRVAFFSLEMGREQLCSRLLSTEASVEGTKLRTGMLEEEEWSRLIEAGDILRKAELYFDDSPGITVNQMKAKVRRLKDVDLVIIDYLQLMSGGKKNDNRVNEISDITRNLKIMAKDLDVPVIAMSQLRRPTERGKDHRPGLSELRDSGSIEQDADIVIFLHREAYNAVSEGGQLTEDMDVSAAELIVAKNRHGATTDIPVHWQPEFMRFTAREFVRHE